MICAEGVGFFIGGVFMIASVGIILMAGLILGKIAGKLKLPPLLGMIAAGMIAGPYCLGLLDDVTLTISADIRKIALVIILAKAGLTLNAADLKRVGRPAVLMCFLPALFEIGGFMLLAPRFLGLSLSEAALLGSVIAAVSPAVVVPRMTKLIEDGCGTEKGIPQLILAGAAADDVFVIAVFSAVTGLLAGGDFSPAGIASVPVSVISGALGGILCGLIFSEFFGKFHFRDTEKIVVFLGVSFLLTALESWLDGIFAFSGLLAVMAMGVTVRVRLPFAASRMAAKFSKIWAAAEILLFALVGAAVNLPYAAKAGAAVILIIPCALLFRMVGVLCCLVKTPLSFKERLFCIVAYLPKATVQAAIGGVPLAMGFACGETVLTAAVISILLTAPLGAWGIDGLSQKLIKTNQVN